MRTVSTLFLGACGGSRFFRFNHEIDHGADDQHDRDNSDDHQCVWHDRFPRRGNASPAPERLSVTTITVVRTDGGGRPSISR